MYFKLFRESETSLSVARREPQEHLAVRASKKALAFCSGAFLRFL